MITSVITAVFAVGYLAATVWLCRGVKLNARALSLGGVVCALTLVLATIRIPLPTGSNITCASWIPLMLLALVYDYRLSMLTGWVCGILAMILIPGWQAVHWAQIFVQQLVCFSCLGYAGVFGWEKRWKAVCGMALAVAFIRLSSLFNSSCPVVLNCGIAAAADHRYSLGQARLLGGLFRDASDDIARFDYFGKSRNIQPRKADEKIRPLAGGRVKKQRALRLNVVCAGFSSHQKTRVVFDKEHAADAPKKPGLVFL